MVDKDFSDTSSGSGFYGSDLDEEFPTLVHRIVGYSGEPEEESVYTSSESEDEVAPAIRLDVREWCTCSNCTNMNTHRERICCDDLEACSEKKDDATIHYGASEPFGCICDHPGFLLVCTRWEVLDIAWNQYRRQYGQAAYDNPNIFKRRRHVAYRQLAYFLFGSVGRHNRFVLPSCAVHKIRQTFPNDNEPYTGFEY